MGLFSHAVAVGVGYALARPEARRKLADLAQHPKVKHLRDQGQDLATTGLHMAKHRLVRSDATGTDVAGADAAGTDATESAATPPYVGVPSPSPSPSSPLPDPAASREGVLPSAEGFGETVEDEDPAAAVTRSPSLPRPVPRTSPTDNP